MSVWPRAQPGPAGPPPPPPPPPAQARAGQAPPAEPLSRPQPAAGRRRSRWVTVAAVAAAGLVLFVCYWRLSRTALINSDGASNALQAWDMLHGNLLLHGWNLSDVSFYTTELPEYMLVELAAEINAGV